MQPSDVLELHIGLGASTRKEEDLMELILKNQRPEKLCRWNDGGTEAKASVGNSLRVVQTVAKANYNIEMLYTIKNHPRTSKI